MKGLRIFQYGCGKMSVYTMKYVIDNGGTRRYNSRCC